MKKLLFLPSFFVAVGLARAELNVYVEQAAGKAWIKYAATEGEVVRAFALDVQVDAGLILGLSDFFVGESTTQAQGYGIFPSSFRDHSTVLNGSEVIWGVPEYTPLAVASDNPGGTLPGLGSSGMSLEFGGLWDPNVSASIPPASGVLCALEISEAANVTVSGNALRGGVVSAAPGPPLAPVYAGAFVDPSGTGPLISSVTLVDGMLTIRFEGGELESSSSLEGEWTGTGNSTGTYVEAIPSDNARFFRVRSN